VPSIALLDKIAMIVFFLMIGQPPRKRKAKAISSSSRQVLSAS